MKQLHRILGFVFTLVLMGSFSASVALAQDPDNGKVLWEEQIFQCSKCHGAAGEGLYSGPRAGDDEATLEEWIEQVRTPKRNMPSFSVEQVSDEQLADIRAYMISLPKPEGEFMPTDPGMSDDPGQNLILQKRCVACHGDTGPIKGFVERGDTPTAEGVIKQLRTPFKRMPSFSVEQVSDEEAALIAEFLAAGVAGQSAPATLPQSGDVTTSNAGLYLSILGIALLLGGFVLRQRVVNRA